MAPKITLNVDGEPVVLCFIAWMREYDGVTDEDTPVWDSARAKQGKARIRGRPRATYFLGESSNFSKVRDKDGKSSVFGHVQARFDIERLGGIGDIAQNVTVVWCASDILKRNAVKIVGWYRHATVHRMEQPLVESVHKRDLERFPDHVGFNVSTQFRNATLLKEYERPFLPVSPGKSDLGRWHSRSKNWYGDQSTQLANFLLRAFDRDPEIIAGSSSGERTPISRREVLQTVRDRQGQIEFRKALLCAYDGRCAITGSKTEQLLDACHVYPARKDDATNGLDNGLLLRTDIHTMFDLGLVAVHPTSRKVWVASSVRDEIYQDLRGKIISEPMPGHKGPSSKNLKWHWATREK